MEVSSPPFLPCTRKPIRPAGELTGTIGPRTGNRDKFNGTVDSELLVERLNHIMMIGAKVELEAGMVTVTVIAVTVTVIAV